MVAATIRTFGPPRGAAAVRVSERVGINSIADPRYGTTALFGCFKRGVPGIPVPINGNGDYQSAMGDPKNQTWHLYKEGSQVTPDAVDGYYAAGNRVGQLWLTRLELPYMRSASVTLKNSLGSPALKITAANPGRWGGAARKIENTPLIYATSRTFTLIAPGVEANEFEGSIVKFGDGTEREYQVVANTRSGTGSNEVIFTIAAQYNLVIDGVNGPTTLSGTASYTRYKDLTGTVSHTSTKPLQGNVVVNDRVLTGTSTRFTRDLVVGRNVYLDGEARVIDSITSDTTATITEAFINAPPGATFEIDNFTIVGVGTTFVSALAVGQMVYVTIAGKRESRMVASISSDVLLEVDSGFSDTFTTSIIQVTNSIVTGVDSAYVAELQAGASYLVDPNRSGAAVKVLQIISPTSVLIEGLFSRDFTDAKLTKQSTTAEVTLLQVGTDGLSIQIGAGTKYPQTHFSVLVLFNGSEVYSVSDASLDRSDPYFIESLINDDGRNIIYKTGAKNHQKWITAECLWDSSYTTGELSDVRPTNGNEKILALTKNRLYTVGDFDYDLLAGRLLFPNPYKVARSSVRVQKTKSPINLTGTVSSLGTIVTGTDSQFRSEVKPGDYFYDAKTKQARRVRVVNSNLIMTLDAAFSANISPLSKGIICGFIECSQGYDLTQMTELGNRFAVTYPQYLAKGYDGNLGGIIPYDYARYFDPDASMLENAAWGKNLGLIKMAVPGVSDVVIQKAAANYAAFVSYEFRAEIPSNYINAAIAEQFVNSELGRNDFQTVSFPSYVFVKSPISNGERLISVSGDQLGQESNKANTAGGYHKPYAGLNAKLPRVTRLPIDIQPQEEALLNLAGITCIKELWGNIVVWGARATALDPMYDFAHVRRIQSNYVRLFLESRQLLSQLFEPNQPEELDQVIMILDNWARSERKKGVFTQYLTFEQSVEIAAANTGSGIVTDSNSAVGLVGVLNGKLQVYISYIPTGIIENLEINISPDIIVSKYGQTLTGV